MHEYAVLSPSGAVLAIVMGSRPDLAARYPECSVVPVSEVPLERLRRYEYWDRRPGYDEGGEQAVSEASHGLYQCITCFGPSDGPGECRTCLGRPRDFAKYLPAEWRSEEERQAAVSAYLLRVYGPGGLPDDVRAAIREAWQRYEESEGPRDGRP